MDEWERGGERERERERERENNTSPPLSFFLLTEPFFMESWKRTLDKYRLGDTERQQRTIFLGIQRSNICYHFIKNTVTFAITSNKYEIYIRISHATLKKNLCYKSWPVHLFPCCVSFPLLFLQLHPLVRMQGSQGKERENPTSGASISCFVLLQKDNN